MMKISVIVPAHNEEKFIGDCLSSVQRAAAELGNPIEIVVCLNRCTDRTEDIARRFGTVIIREDEKNIARIRNTAAKAATGEIIVTIDADSRMSANMLKEVHRRIEAGKYIGGGTVTKPERLSLGIVCSLLVVGFFALRAGFRSAGLFWCLKKDFDAISGFNEKLVSLEDLDFAHRLAAFGKTTGRKYGTIGRAFIVTSCRKFDKFGDWYLFKNPALVKSIFTGVDRESADKFYYDIER